MALAFDLHAILVSSQKVEVVCSNPLKMGHPWEWVEWKLAPSNLSPFSWATTNGQENVFTSTF